MAEKPSTSSSVNTLIVDEEGLVRSQGDTGGIDCGSARQGSPSPTCQILPSQEESCNQMLMVCIDADHAKCSICLNIWHDVVTVGPCLHNFCNGCFSEWLKRSQEKHANVLCPQCREVVQFVGKNHFLHGIEEDILQADPSLKRSDEEIATLDSYASIKSNLVIQTGKKFIRKRLASQIEEESDVDMSCPQCVSALCGFRCNHNTAHLRCHSCGGMMPSRTDFSVPQHCLGCNRAFCGAYWNSLGYNGSDSHSVCGRDTFLPISERNVSRIPFLAHENNRHEQEITEKCIRQMGRPLQDVISDWARKLDNREMDRTRMLLNHSERITSATHVCSDCYDKLVSFLLYWFRCSLPRHILLATSAEAANREDCWYGYACRTQHHKAQHARQYNHVCRPINGRTRS